MKSFGTLLLYFSEDTRFDKDASDSVGQKSLICWMWTATVSAALGNKYCDVRQTHTLSSPPPPLSLSNSYSSYIYHLTNFFVSMQ